MNRRTQYTVGMSLAGLSAVALAGAAYITFAFPEAMAQWEEEGRALSGVEQTLANTSHFWANFGPLLTAALFLAVIGCGAWAVIAKRTDHC